MAEYITKKAAINTVENVPIELFQSEWEEIEEAINAAPAADVAPVVHGRWERDADGDWYCTNCDEVVAICESGRERTYRKPYCPNCGAKMDRGADNG
jgi:ribosomal protein L37AE/L43A